jgi:hypothetical protein
MDPVTMMMGAKVAQAALPVALPVIDKLADKGPILMGAWSDLVTKVSPFHMVFNAMTKRAQPLPAREVGHGPGSSETAVAVVAIGGVIVALTGLAVVHLTKAVVTSPAAEALRETAVAGRNASDALKGFGQLAQHSGAAAAASEAADIVSQAAAAARGAENSVRDALRRVGITF